MLHASWSQLEMVKKYETCVIPACSCAELAGLFQCDIWLIADREPAWFNVVLKPSKLSFTDAEVPIMQAANM